jgi:polar amino acid transport system substrate-binding protein
VRWTERRNMQEFLRLVATGQVTPSRLSTHRFPVERAAEAYEMITGERQEPFLGILLSYPEAGPQKQRTVELREARPRSGRIGLGVIGAGSFGGSVLLPRFASHKENELVGIATSTGVSSRKVGDKFAFQYCTTDTDALLQDERINAVVIATRHDSHARLVAESLRAGKAVFVEKPLAIDETGLRQVLEAQAESGQLLTVGFNRRFSPLSEQLRKQFSAAGPLAITYRVNAGPLPPEHWLHDPLEGGGRIIGEACHFVDLLQFITGEEPIEVFAHSLGGPAGARHETVSIVFRFSKGSVANINYFANGDRSYPKERIEVFGGGAIGVLDDFRHLSIISGGKQKEWKTKAQEKGFDQEVSAFVRAVRDGTEPPISLRSLVLTTKATFAVEEALETGRPVRIDSDLDQLLLSAPLSSDH